MSLSLSVLAGSVSTALFVASTLPMLVKAARTRDLGSYSVGNLVLANVGNLTYAVYVVDLPVGPIWALHSFYLVSSAAMLAMWVGYRASSRRSASRGSRSTPTSSSPTAASSTPSQPRWPTCSGRKKRSGSVSVTSA